MKTFIYFTFFALCLLCCVHKAKGREAGVCYSSATRYRTAYRTFRSGYDSYRCGFLWLGRCRRATYRRESYRMSYTVTERGCCSGYTRCTYNRSRCCQNECRSRRTNDCDQICRDTDTSYICSCHSGYHLASNRRSCNDINECAEHTSRCTQICINTIGSYYCSCETDYCLAHDGLTCDYNTFLVKPRNSRVTLGENATFNCQFPGTDAVIEWKVNNVSLSEQADMNISNQIKPNYNGTTVKCLARLVSNQCREEVESDSVNLLIQGKLEAVSDLHIVEKPGQILISWQPPFSLNLTDRDYSITYCIGIIEDSSGKFYVLACNVTETNYTYNIYDSQTIISIPFIVIVTPENNLGKGKEHNATVNKYYYNIVNNGCQYNCYNGPNGSESLSPHQIIATTASVATIITAFVSVSCIVTITLWIIDRRTRPAIIDNVTASMIMRHQGGQSRSHAACSTTISQNSSARSGLPVVQES